MTNLLLLAIAVALVAHAAQLHRINRKIKHMSAQIDDLKSAVTAENTVIDGAIVLIQGLAAQIAALPADAAAIAQLASDVRAKSDALAAAVAAGTPPAPAP